MLLAYLHIRIVVGPGVGEGDLEVGVGDFAVGDYLEILEYLDIALVGVHDDVEILVGSEHLGEYVAERLFQHGDHRGLVDVLKFLEFGETLHHVGSFFFSCHIL